MPDLPELIEKVRNLRFIGAGNVLKQDDGVGVVISRHIVERANIRILTVEVSIENYIGKINSMERPGDFLSPPVQFAEKRIVDQINLQIKLLCPTITIVPSAEAT